MRAIVIHRHAATDVEHPHGSALFDQIAIDAHGLGGTLTDGRDVGNLRTLMIVQHPQAAQVALLLELIHHTDDLRSIETEDRLVPGAFLPMPGTACRESDAYPEIWQHVDFSRSFKNEVELTGHFKHQHHSEAHLLGVQGKVDEFLILVAVADDVGLGVVHVRECCNQLGLGACLESIMVFLTKLRDLLDHLTLLVDFDRIHSAVFSTITDFGHRLVEGFIDFSDAGVKQVAKTHQYRHMGAPVA